MSEFTNFIFRNRRVVLAGLIALWIGAFAATHIPRSGLPQAENMPGDFTLHLLGYFGLSTAFLATLRAYGKSRTRRVLTLVVVIFFYSCFDELTQALVNRGCEIEDVIIDTSAAIAAAIVWETLGYLFHQRFLKSSSQSA